MAEPSIVVEKNVATPMRDGVVLRVDVYRPAAVGKCPVLLQRTPYNKNFNLIFTLLLDVMRAASEGYAVVIQDSRGRYASEGESTHFAMIFLTATIPLNGARRSLGLMERPSASSCQGWTIASIGLSLIARRILTNLNRPPQWGASCKTVEVLPAPLGAAHAMRRFASRLVARVKGMHSPPCWSCLLGPCVEEQGGLSPAFAQSIRWPVLAGDVA